MATNKQDLDHLIHVDLLKSSMTEFGTKTSTLIPTIKQMLADGIKIGVLVIDEDHRAAMSPNEADSHVSERQECLIEFSIKHHLPLWFIDSTRPGLTNKIPKGYSFSRITKGDANGFGDGIDDFGPRRNRQNDHLFDTGLHSQLQEKNITHLVVLGFHVHCCVQLTVGATSSKDYGPGALQLGYQVLTSLDVLRSSATHPAGEERCHWKEFAGVSCFNSIKSFDVFNKISQIRTIIASYSGVNKQSMVRSFLQNIDEILDSHDEIETIKMHIGVCLDELQGNETQYYQQLTFFSDWRKSNSELQPKLVMANAVLEEFEQLDEEQRTLTQTTDGISSFRGS